MEVRGAISAQFFYNYSEHAFFHKRIFYLSAHFSLTVRRKNSSDHCPEGIVTAVHNLVHALRANFIKTTYHLFMEKQLVNVSIFSHSFDFHFLSNRCTIGITFLLYNHQLGSWVSFVNGTKDIGYRLWSTAPSRCSCHEYGSLACDFIIPISQWDEEPPPASCLVWL